MPRCLLSRIYSYTQLGEAKPAAVLAGAVSAHFPLSVAATYHYERLQIDEAMVSARGALGEAAYSTALEQGATMDDHEVADYALGEFRRVAALPAEPDAQAPESPPGMARLSGTE
jgi:hypothetical protein